jgi:hypothetical protein
MKCKYLFLLQEPDEKIGQNRRMSAIDIVKLDKMYEGSSYTTEEVSNSTAEENSTSTTEGNSTFTTEENSSYTPRPQFITLIIITLNVLTHLQ